MSHEQRGDTRTHGTRLAVVREARALVRELEPGKLARILNDDFDEFGRELEQLNRELWAALVRYAGEADQWGLAAARGCSSTKVMPQQSLNISMAEASLRVRAARTTLPQDLPSGGETPPTLPVLAAAVDARTIDPAHVNITMATMKRLPPNLPPEQRDAAEEFLVGHATTTDPDHFRKVARRLEETIDPDGRLDERDPSAKVELHIGTRSIATGLTSITGRLDDLGVESRRKAVDGLSAPRPEFEGMCDDRSAPVRRAQALIEVLTHSLQHADLPLQAGERSQITVPLDWDVLTQQAGVATLDNGATLSTVDIRRLLCDAQIIPSVLGTHGEIMDLGRTARTLNRATRPAIALRDKGCAFPGCSRPPALCDAHHVRWWAREFGLTSYDNGVLLCPFHHLTIHRSE